MKYLIIVIIMSITFVSCEKVIDIDLNTTQPQYVMQANLFSGQHDFIVNITQTTSYFNPKDPKGIANASVLLIDNNNIQHQVIYEQEGNYLLPNFTAISGIEYRLKVTIDGEVYEASEVVPELVPIDSYSGVYYTDEEFGEEETYFGIEIIFSDPAEKNNYYQIVRYINNEVEEGRGNYMFRDYTYEESVITEFVGFYGELNNGDSLKVELRSIDESTYEFFQTLGEITDGGGGPMGGSTPANPTTNWSNGGLGYFGTVISDDAMVVFEN